MGVYCSDSRGASTGPPPASSGLTLNAQHEPGVCTWPHERPLSSSPLKATSQRLLAARGALWNKPVWDGVTRAAGALRRPSV